MKDNFWTLLKTLIAIAVSFVIYSYFSGDFSSNFNQSTLINSSLDMLNEILAENVNNSETGENARKSFQSFSEKISKGEIAPEEFQDIAAAILNMRMEEGFSKNSDLEKIILDMNSARKIAELNRMTGESLNEKYESIALKIEELAAFQVENLPNLILNDQWSKIELAEKLPSITDKMEILISFDPVEAVREAPASSVNRRTFNTTIIESAPVIVPLIKITENLDVLVDSIRISNLDSVKLIHLKKSLDRLQHAKSLHIKIKKKLVKAAETAPSNE